MMYLNLTSYFGAPDKALYMHYHLQLIMVVVCLTQLNHDNSLQQCISLRSDSGNGLSSVKIE